MLSLLLTTMLFPPAPVEPPIEAPKGPAPRIAILQVNSTGKIVAYETQTQYVTEQRIVPVNINGRVVQRTQYFTVPVWVTVTHHWDLDRATITEASGKAIDARELVKRLATPTPVVVSTDGKPVDKGYLRLFNKKTIVIVAPVQAGPPVGVTTPAPLPPQVRVPKR